MRTIILDFDAIDALLHRAQVGRLATTDAGGYPYITPVSFAWADGCIYVHTSVRGERLANILANSKVGFEVDEAGDLVTSDRPCNTSVRYSSVILRGTARILDDPAQKYRGLDALVAKYIPQHVGKDMPESSIARTTVIAIVPDSCTGKHHTDA